MAELGRAPLVAFMQDTSRFAIQLETRPSVLRLARKLVATAAVLAGADAPTAAAIEVATGEALNNAHIHAHRRAACPLELEIVVEGGVFSVTVHDRGEPPTLPVIPDAPPAHPGNGGGRGLYIIKQLMDDAVVEPARGRRGTAIRMVKKLF